MLKELQLAGSRLHLGQLHVCVCVCDNGSPSGGTRENLKGGLRAHKGAQSSDSTMLTQVETWYLCSFTHRYYLIDRSDMHANESS